MEKVKITLVVPERIAALVQNYVQVNLLGKGKWDFIEHLDDSDVENPEQYLPEMEIGIEHPDDEPVKIASYWLNDYSEVNKWLLEATLFTYIDTEHEEHLYSIDCLDVANFIPQIVIDFVESVKATDCSYFRFVNSKRDENDKSMLD